MMGLYSTQMMSTAIFPWMWTSFLFHRHWLNQHEEAPPLILEYLLSRRIFPGMWTYNSDHCRLSRFQKLVKMYSSVNFVLSDYYADSLWLVFVQILHWFCPKHNFIFSKSILNHLLLFFTVLVLVSVRRN